MCRAILAGGRRCTGTHSGTNPGGRRAHRRAGRQAWLIGRTTVDPRYDQVDGEPAPTEVYYPLTGPLRRDQYEQALRDVNAHTPSIGMGDSESKAYAITVSALQDRIQDRSNISTREVWSDMLAGRFSIVVEDSDTTESLTVAAEAAMNADPTAHADCVPIGEARIRAGRNAALSVIARRRHGVKCVRCSQWVSTLYGATTPDGFVCTNCANKAAKDDETLYAASVVNDEYTNGQQDVPDGDFGTITFGPDGAPLLAEETPAAPEELYYLSDTKGKGRLLLDEHGQPRLFTNAEATDLIIHGQAGNSYVPAEMIVVKDGRGFVTADPAAEAWKYERAELAADAARAAETAGYEAHQVLTNAKVPTAPVYDPPVAGVHTGDSAMGIRLGSGGEWQRHLDSGPWDGLTLLDSGEINLEGKWTSATGDIVMGFRDTAGREWVARELGVGVHVPGTPYVGMPSWEVTEVTGRYKAGLKAACGGEKLTRSRKPFSTDFHRGADRVTSPASKKVAKELGQRWTPAYMDSVVADHGDTRYDEHRLVETITLYSESGHVLASTRGAVVSDADGGIGLKLARKAGWTDTLNIRASTATWSCLDGARTPVSVKDGPGYASWIGDANASVVPTLEWLDGGGPLAEAAAVAAVSRQLMGPEPHRGYGRAENAA